MALPLHSTASGIDLHEDKRVKEPVRAATTANISLTTPGTTMDGVALNSGDRVLLKNQSPSTQNGLYTWAGSTTTLVRTSDADAAADFVHGFLVFVREGTTNGATYWVYATSLTPIVVGSTALIFNPFNVASGTVSSVALTAPAEFSVTGSPVTSSGTLAIAKATQAANTVWAGPGSGAAAVPAFRVIGPADLPVFGPSGGSHSAGAVPDPGAVAGATKFLREDQSWQIPAGTGGGGGSSGGSGSLSPIAVIGPLTVSQPTMTFSGIPQTAYRNLRVRVKVRSTHAAGTVTIGVRVNSDSSSLYGYETLVDSSSGLIRVSSESATSAVLGNVTAGSAEANAFGILDIAIPNYADAQHKSFSTTGGYEQSTSVGDQYTQIGSGFYRATTAISSLDLVLSNGDFDVGSYACLYGELDTAAPLLAPASNMLYETILTQATATISTGTLSQSYRDLRIELSGIRGDAAATEIGFLMRFNGDTATNYDWTRVSNSATTVVGLDASAATSIQAFTTTLGVTASTATAGAASSISIVIPGYTGTTYWKTAELHVADSLGSGANNRRVTDVAGFWRSTSAISSIQFTLSSGNFMAGAAVRVYGEPVSAGGASVGTGTRLRISANQSIADATDTIVSWDTEDSDADTQHYTTSTALTSGTVAKTAASATLVGTGTVFTTDLAVGQVISVPGTAVEKRVVIAIASDTSLTVNTPYANTASTQVGTRLNSPIVFRQPGFFDLKAEAYWASNATGNRKVALILNDTTVISQDDCTAVGSTTAMSHMTAVARGFQQWDFVEVQVRQNSGGALNLTTDDRTSFSCLARPTTYVAGPTFGASGTNHTTGWVPDPGASSGTTRFLREDATFAVPASTGGGGTSSGSGGSGALVPIQVVGPLTAAQSTLSLSAPVTGFRNLRIRGLLRGDTAAATTTTLLTFNGDTGANYNYERTSATATSTASAEFLSQANIEVANMPANTATASRAASVEIAVLGYADSFHKTVVATNHFSYNDSTANTQHRIYSGTWRNTSAITTVLLTPGAGNFAIGSYVCLYGEMDTAGVLLTPASNLLYETTLTAVAGSIDTGTLSQSYRDLRVVFYGRGDTAAKYTELSLRLNGDSGSNYDYSRQESYVSGGGQNQFSSTSATSMQLLRFAASTAPANMYGSAQFLISNYAVAGNFKPVLGQGNNPSTTAADVIGSTGQGEWRNTAAVTSLTLLPGAGNFVAGTVVRVYGEPVSAGGASVGTGTHLKINANQAIATGAGSTVMLWDGENADADNQHYLSGAALSSGTVSKTAGSQTLTGAGTVFTTDLSVGQVITVPGTSDEQRVVIAIASNTSLTVNRAYGFTASTQVATRNNSAIVMRQPGQYSFDIGIFFAGNATGYRRVTLALNGSVGGSIIGDVSVPSIGATGFGVSLSVQRPLQQWDFVEVLVSQTSGGSLDVQNGDTTFFACSSRPTVIVAIPYVCIRDEKAAGTNGGSFTSGAWRLRTLNTVQSNDAGIASLASNQVTLLPGTYRTHIAVPGYGVNDHMARLYNATASAVILEGIGTRSSSSNADCQSIIDGRFTLTVASALQVEHACETTNATDGLGRSMNLGVLNTKNVYTVAEFWKES